MKAVFFDFDGTLTYKSPNIWKEIWKSCGYETGKQSYFASLFGRFMRQEITHQEWCDLTCAEFIKSDFNIATLCELADSINLIDGFDKILEELKNNDISLHIVSGNLVPVIKRVLGDKIKYFDSINGNDISFDDQGHITFIKGTNYDFEGKAKFIEEYKEKTNSYASELVFIGNGDNDEWVHLSGCKTICINPDDADFTNSTKCHISKENVTNLTEILAELNLQSSSLQDEFVK